MSGFVQSLLLLMLTASVVMLIWLTVFYSRLLVSAVRRRWYLFLLPLCFLLMAARRFVILYHILAGTGVMHMEEFFAEAVSFAGTVLLVAGFLAASSVLKKGFSAVSDDTTPETIPFCELFSSISSAVMVFEAVDKGRHYVIRDMNPAAERLEKLMHEHAVGRRLRDVFPGIEEFGLPEVLYRVWHTGHPEMFPMHYYQDDRVDGWRDTYVYRSAKGLLVAVYDDISAQVHMQEELETRERRFRLLYEQAPLPYQSLDGEGRILDVNPAWTRLAGISGDEAEGREFQELLTKASRQTFQGCLEQLKKDQSVRDVSLDMRSPDGSFRAIELDALALKDRDGALQQIYCILQELDAGHPVRASVSEEQVRARAEEMIQSDRDQLRMQKIYMLGELAAGMANELNVSLTAARNAFNLMREDISPASPHYEFVEIARREISQMTDFVEQVYRFHEPASADAEPLNLNALLDNTLILIRSQMKDQGVMLNDERAKSIPSVELPPAAVMQVLLQPVRNAVQAMPRGGNLTFRTAVDPAGVRVEIADSGPGIPESFLPRIFEPFASFRHEGSPNDCVGLGLTVALHILMEIGGTITVSSPDGQGTRVQIVFPLTVKPFEKDLQC